MSQEKLDQYRTENTREVKMPDGSKQVVKMSADLWEDLEFLRIVEGISSTELVPYAQEEMKLQDVTFDRAYRGVVAHLANRWTAGE